MDVSNHTEYSNEITEKLRELELELSEGDITEKGFAKKKALLLQKYSKDALIIMPNKPLQQLQQIDMKGDQSINPTLIDQPVTRKKDGRRYTRDESRYRSAQSNQLELRDSYSGGDIREEAVREALAKHKGQEALVPSKRKDPLSISSEDDPKRISGLGGPSFRNTENRLQEHDSDSEDDDEDDTTNLSSDGSTRHRIKLIDAVTVASTTVPLPGVVAIGNPLSQAPSSSCHKSPRVSRRDAAASQQQTSNLPRPQPRSRINVAVKDSESITSNSRQSRFQNGAHGVPPDVTSHTPNALKDQNSVTTDSITSSIGDNVRRSRDDASCPSQTGSVNSLQTGGTNNGAIENGLVSSRVSEKIQQLVQTLKRPKRRPLPEYFQEDENLAVLTTFEDPNAPKPKGTVIEPAVGESLNMLSGLPRSLESALQSYAQAHGKQSVMSCIDSNGRVNGISLTYTKLLQRANRIAYLLLNKLGHRGEHSLKPRDRVALVFANNDPINFICAFYGCIMASVVPLSIEVPLMRRDASCQSMGFLLNSQEIRIVLTSEMCYKSLPRTPSGEIEAFSGWPKVQWINIDHHAANKPSRDWQPPERLSDDECLYIEYSYAAKDGSVRGVTVSRRAALEHCRTLATVCRYAEGETLVCVSELKRETGLWHSVLTAIYTGLHVVFIPYAVLKVDPAIWLKQITRHKAAAAIVKSRDMHWALLAEKEHNMINLSCLRVLLVSDGSNPWSLNTCDNFISAFRQKGLRSTALCPCAGSSETMTLSLRRPTAGYGVEDSLDVTSGIGESLETGCASPGGRGVLSMHSLSYGLVRVDSENSLTSLTLQDCGQILPGGKAVVIKPNGLPYLCHTDEVGEVCLQASYTGSGYWGLQGQTNVYFKVQPLDSSGNVIDPNGSGYVRSGLLGFLGPAKSGGLLFICGSVQGLMTVSGRRHNADDIIATVLAVEPMKIVFRGRIAVFSIPLLRDERIVIVAELRNGFSEEAAFKWMSRVIQAVDSIHQAAVYCIVLVPHNYLPKTPLGGIHVYDTKRRFLEGRLSACNVLLCPHGAITNLPKPRDMPSGQVGPSAMMVGHLVQGNRLAWAQGRDISVEIESKTISQILIDRAINTPNSRLFCQLNTRMQEVSSFTFSQLQRRAERIACYLVEKRKIPAKTLIAVLYSPGIELVCAVYACMLCGCIPVTIKPPSTPTGVNNTGNQNSTLAFNTSQTISSSSTSVDAIASSLEAARQIMNACNCSIVLTCGAVIKVIKAQRVNLTDGQNMIDTDDLPKKRLVSHDFYRPQSLDEVAYIDFSWSPQGVPIGVRQTHSALLHICQAQKLQCEFYPSREVVLSLDPYSGLGFTLWCLSGVYCGHLSYFVPPQLLEAQPDLWLTACSTKQVRDTFCSYSAIELSTKYLANSIPALKQRGISLNCLRSLVIVAEERPRVQSTNNFCKLFSVLGLNSRAVSTSFGCRVNIAICLQGASSPDTSNVYVDQVSLRNDRVKLLEKGSPHSLCLLESGKLLPGVRIAIAHPETMGQCADSHLGEIWVSSPFNSSDLIVPNDNGEAKKQLSMKLATGEIEGVYARTGYLGFVRRTELTQSDGERHDAVFVVGALENTIMLRGMRYHPIDIESTVMRCHKSKIAECVVFTWSNLLVVVVELNGEDWEAVDLVHLVTSSVLEEHYLIVGVVVVVDRGTIQVNSRGEKERVQLRDMFVNDKLDPMYVSYNM